jgi:hypothetical protein
MCDAADQCRRGREISLTPGQQEQMGRMRKGSMTRICSGVFDICVNNGVAVPELGPAALPLCLYRQFCACSRHRLDALVVCRAAGGDDDEPGSSEHRVNQLSIL